MDREKCVTLFMYLIVCLIIGGRLFSCLFYEGSMYYWTHPHLIFWPFRNGRFVGLPGMSYHGGALGAVFGCWLFCRRYGFRFLETGDAIAVGVPLGYTFGRLGNFINAELWGRCTGSRYGMVFPYAERFSSSLEWVRTAADKAGIAYSEGSFVNLPRHPSQLYEAFFEGIVLFIVLWFVVKPYARKKDCPFGHGFISGCYFLGYGFVRFFIEYFREPDEQLGFVIALGRETEPVALFRSFWNFSLGQVLCFLMILLGVILIKWSHDNREKESSATQSASRKKAAAQGTEGRGASSRGGAGRSSASWKDSGLASGSRRAEGGDAASVNMPKNSRQGKGGKKNDER